MSVADENTISVEKDLKTGQISRVYYKDRRFKVTHRAVISDRITIRLDFIQAIHVRHGHYVVSFLISILGLLTIFTFNWFFKPLEQIVLVVTFLLVPVIFSRWAYIEFVPAFGKAQSFFWLSGAIKKIREATDNAIQEREDFNKGSSTISQYPTVDESTYLTEAGK